MPLVKDKKNKVKKVSVAKKASPKPAAKPAAKPSSATKTATATKTSTETKTSTDAYTQGNITVTGGAGKGSTSVTIALPGGSLENKSKPANTAKAATKAKVKKKK